MSPPYEPDEIMTVVAARSLADGASCLVGVGLPSAAANLARRLHAPDLLLVYESGAIGARPEVLPLSIGDGELAETALTVVTVPEIFAYWLGGGRIDVGFLGAAQIDRFGNLNSTVIGPYDAPGVRLPGAGGAPEIAEGAKEILVVARHSTRTFVTKLDFVTTSGRHVTRVITDLGVLEPGDDGELLLTQVHPGIPVDAVRSATGWPLRTSETVLVTPTPTPTELDALRELRSRTARAHAESRHRV